MTRRLLTVVVSVALALPLALLMPSPLLADSSVSRDDALGAVQAYFDGDSDCEQTEAFVARYRGESSDSDAVCSDEPLALAMSVGMEELPASASSAAPPGNSDPPLFSDPPDERAAATAGSQGANSEETEPSKFLDLQVDRAFPATAIGEPAFTSYRNTANDYAQSVVTGPHKYGYKVNTVGLDLCFGTPDARIQADNPCPARPQGKSDPPYTVSIWTAKISDDDSLDSGAGTNYRKRRYLVPDTKLVELDKPGQLVAGSNQFTVPDGGIVVAPGTAFVVVFDFTHTPGGSEPKLLFSNSDAIPSFGDPSTTDPSGSGWGANFHRTKSSNLKFATGCRDEEDEEINCNDPDVLPIYRIKYQERLNVAIRWDTEAQAWKSLGSGNSLAPFAGLTLSVSGSNYGGPLLSNLSFHYQRHPNPDYRGRQNDYAQVGQLDPRGCGGTRMPSLTSEQLFAGDTWYCNTRTGTWVPGRWMRPCDKDNPTYDANICGSGT